MVPGQEFTVWRLGMGQFTPVIEIVVTMTVQVVFGMESPLVEAIIYVFG